MNAARIAPRNTSDAAPDERVVCANVAAAAVEVVNAEVDAKLDGGRIPLMADCTAALLACVDICRLLVEVFAGGALASGAQRAVVELCRDTCRRVVEAFRAPGDVNHETIDALSSCAQACDDLLVA